MRPLALLLVLALLPGCTFVFGATGALSHADARRRAERPVPLDAALADGTWLSVTTRTGTIEKGRWRGFTTAPGDTARLVRLERRRQPDALVPLADVAAVHPVVRGSPAAGFLIGLALDAVVVGLAVRSLAAACIPGGCNTPPP